MKELIAYSTAELIEELKKRRLALSVWYIEDIDVVLTNWNDSDPRLHPSLTHEEKWSILKNIGENHNANEGINWGVIESYIESYLTSRQGTGNKPLTRQWR